MTAKRILITYTVGVIDFFLRSDFYWSFHYEQWWKPVRYTAVDVQDPNKLKRRENKATIHTPRVWQAH